MKIREVFFWICLPIFVVIGSIMCLLGWNMDESDYEKEVINV